MTDAVKKALETAYRHLRNTTLATAVASDSSGRVRAIALKTLEEMKRRIEDDPKYIDEIANAARLPVDEGP